MMEEGAAKARALGCKTITLLPEQDTGAQYFYEKCGFRRGETLYSCTLSAIEGGVQGRRLQEAPFLLIREKPFLFGLAQTAAHHMWQVFNRRMPGDKRQVDTLETDVACVQLGAFRRDRHAVALIWAEEEDAEKAVRQACLFAGELGYPGVKLYFLEASRRFVPEKICTVENYEMYLPL